MHRRWSKLIMQPKVDFPITLTATALSHGLVEKDNIFDRAPSLLFLNSTNALVVVCIPSGRIQILSQETGGCEPGFAYRYTVLTLCKHFLDNLT